MPNISYKSFTLGVEEEYIVIDPVTRELKSHEQKIVTEGHKIISDKVKAEMHQAVVEVGTDICQNIEEAYRDVSVLRKTISYIAGDLGFWVGASGTHPFSHWENQLITDLLSPTDANSGQNKADLKDEKRQSTVVLELGAML